MPPHLSNPKTPHRNRFICKLGGPAIASVLQFLNKSDIIVLTDSAISYDEFYHTFFISHFALFAIFFAHFSGARQSANPQRSDFDSRALNGKQKKFLSPVGGGNLSPRNVMKQSGALNGSSFRPLQKLPLGWCSAQRIKISMIASGNHTLIY